MLALNLWDRLRTLTMQLEELNPRMIALAAKTTVARCFGRLYTASR